MATGIPKKRTTKQDQQSHSDNGLILAYEGRQDEATILGGRRAELVRVSGAAPAQNSLLFGDNLSVLRSLLHDVNVRGQVRLIYIDPPFATQTVFESRKQNHAFDDMMAGAEFVEFLRQRLVLLKELLAADGSIYVHLDEKMVFPIKLIMDEVFGSENFRNIITRKKCNPKNYTRKQFGHVSDFILFYSKSGEYLFNRPHGELTEKHGKEYRHIEEETGRRYMKVPVHAPGVRNGETGKEWKGMMPPPGKHWQYTPARLDEMDARGEIVWSPTGNPRRKVYLDEAPGTPVQDIWTEFRDAHNQMIRVTGYPTEKNFDMMKLIVEASSNPGDLVLDAFCGSGTTLDAAEELGRRWIGIDKSPEAIKTTLKRLVHGSELMGDFVSERNGGTLHKDLKPLVLFDEVQSIERSSRVVDFAVYAEKELVSEARRVLPAAHSKKRLATT